MNVWPFPRQDTASPLRRPADGHLSYGEKPRWCMVFLRICLPVNRQVW